MFNNINIIVTLKKEVNIFSSNLTIKTVYTICIPTFDLINTVIIVVIFNLISIEPID